MFSTCHFHLFLLVSGLAIFGLTQNLPDTHEYNREITFEKHVAVLNSENFNSYVLSGKAPVFVAIYASWCHWSNLAISELEEVGHFLHYVQMPVTIGKLDGSRYHELAIQLHINRYPTLRLFFNHTYVDFTGLRTKETMLDWLYRTLQLSHEIYQVEALQILFESFANQFILVAGVSLSPEHIIAFEKSAVQTRGQSFFVYSHNEKTEQEIIKRVQSTHNQPSSLELPTTYVVLFNPFEGENPVEFLTDHESLNSENISNFVEFYLLPSVVIFNDIWIDQILDDPKPSVILCVETDSDSMEHSLTNISMKGITTQMKQEFINLARTYRSNFSFVIIPYNDSHSRQLTNFLVIDQFNLPAVRILRITKSNQTQLSKFKSKKFEDGVFDIRNVKIFLDDYKDGKLNPYLKSENQEDVIQDGSVISVVGNNFEKEVLLSTDDVFVEFYAPWCGHCRKLESTYQKLGIIAKGVDHLKIVKIDASRNEIDKIAIRGYPTLVLFPAHNKEVPILYNGSRTLDHFLHWLEKRVQLAKFDASEVLSNFIQSAGYESHEDEEL